MRHRIRRGVSEPAHRLGERAELSRAVVADGSQGRERRRGGSRARYARFFGSFRTKRLNVAGSCMPSRKYEAPIMSS